ncbi:uncharacterized protein LOC110085001 [Pogona vitticeps]
MIKPGLLALRRSRGTACLVQLLFLPLFVAEEEGQQTGISDNVKCLNNYGLGGCRVDCIWHRRGTPGEAQFSLSFSRLVLRQPGAPAQEKAGSPNAWSIHSDAGHFRCNLSAFPKAQETYRCSTECEDEFTENDQYRVSLQAAFPGKTLVYPVFALYEPRMNILCDPPVDLKSNMSSNKCRIQWKKPPAYEYIFLGDWQWELAFKTTQAPWEQAQTKTLVNKDAFVEIDGSQLLPGTNYTARLRCKTPDTEERYRSYWSPWSPATTWKTPPEADGPKLLDPSHLRSLLFLALPFCLGALLLALKVFSRAKASWGAKIPTPAAFFQPLYIAHNGDFKDWAGLTEKGPWLASGIGNHSPTKGSSKGDKGNGALTTSPIKAVTHKGPQLLPEESPACLYIMVEEVAPEQVQKGLQPNCRHGAEPPLPLPWGSSLWVKGHGEAGQEGAPPLKGREGPHHPEWGPQTLPSSSSSSSSDYCMWGSDSSSRPGSIAKTKTLQGIWLGRLSSTSENPCQATPGSPSLTDASCSPQL